MTTQNGWPTIDSFQLDKSPIPGTNVIPVPGLRAGDVATVLLYVGKLFNERVASVYNPGCWGWAPVTPIPGSAVLSNHGSGTAIDLNAPSFPWKIRNMTDSQRNACRNIVNELDGVVAWGGDFGTYVDEMHFEINASEQEVAALANKIKGVGDNMATDFTINAAYKLAYGKDATPKQLEEHRGDTDDQLLGGFLNAGDYIANRPLEAGVISRAYELYYGDPASKEQIAYHQKNTASLYDLLGGFLQAGDGMAAQLKKELAKAGKLDDESVLKFLQERLKEKK